MVNHEGTFHSIIFKILKLLTFILAISSLSNACVSGATFSESCQQQNHSQNRTAENAAKSMNSMSFLEQLVKLKDTCNEDYYQENGNEEGTHTETTHIVEYTGQLWFLRKTPLRFQEAITISDISPCGKFSSIECITKYKTGPTASWSDCSRVSCSFRHETGGDGENNKFDMSVSSELLVRLPLFGIGKAVRKHISNTFENAANVFFEGITGEGDELTIENACDTK